MTQRRSRAAGARIRHGAAAEPDLFAAAGVEVARYEPALVTASEVAEPAPASRRTARDATGETATAAVSVCAITLLAREVLEGAFPPIWVRGEICDFKAHRNGHWYFCLRDDTSQIRCVVWARDRARIPAAPDEGMQIVARGQLTVYPARGEMQFVVNQLDGVGDGLWRKALEQTRERLLRDGLLDAGRKRALPKFPRRVAVVTSADGAAIRDIIAVARRRSPGVEIVLCPARVQGEGAPEEIVAALARLERWGGADIVIVGRGGGAREDLWAFNDERVARAVAACGVPTISAVGHETDFTLCDLVADLRAPTPSAAAEAAVPVRDQLMRELGTVRDALRTLLARRASSARRTLGGAARDLTFAAERAAERRRARIEGAAGQLHVLSPLAVLARGYSVARGLDGETLVSARSFRPGVPFELILRDGAIRATTDERVVRRS
ncbi:MAG: exodeoxyribonuclease VII large subunit [Gemmatimonadaceae bacterium]